MRIISFGGWRKGFPLVRLPEEAKMKTIPFKLFAILGITVSLFLLSTWHNAIAAENPQIPLSNPEIAYDTSNNVWAFVGNKNGKMYVQIYNNNDDRFTPGNRLLGEKCISPMIHTPQRRGTEDFYFIRESNESLRRKYGRGNSVHGSTDMTNPNLTYSYKNPRIVYNRKTNNFLAIWTQYNDNLGEQLVGQLIRYTKRNNKISTWDEPRILNKVFFTKNSNRWVPYKDTRISQVDIDVDTKDQYHYDYAIVSITLRFINSDLKLPQIHLVPVILSENSGAYHYNINDSRYFCEYQGWPSRERKLKGVSACVNFRWENFGEEKPEFHIIYTLTDNYTGQDLIAMWKTDIDLNPNRNNWQQHPMEIIVQGETSINNPPIVRKYIWPVIMYTWFEENSYYISVLETDVRPDEVLCVSNEDLVSNVRIDVDYNENDLFHTALDLLTPDSIIPYILNPRIITTSYGCLLTFQKNYKISFEEKTLDFSYVHGKYINLMHRSENTSDYYLVSQGQPVDRKNKGIIFNHANFKIMCYWNSGGINASPNRIEWSRVYEVNTPSYNPYLIGLYSPRRNAVDFTWQPYPARNYGSIADAPFYSIYIITPDARIRTPIYPRTQYGTRATWENTCNVPEICSVLCVSGVAAPRLSIAMVSASDSNNLSGFTSSETPAIDTDRDALTDDEERNIYHTNPDQPDTLNLAVELAVNPTAYASSEFGGNYGADRAIDGGLNDDTHPPNQEWATRGERNGTFLEITWSRPVPIKRFRLYDRRNTNDNITQFSILVYTEDGAEVRLTGLGPLDNGPADRSTPARYYEYNIYSTLRTNRIRILITGTSPATQNIGVAEIEVYNN